MNEPYPSILTEEERRALRARRHARRRRRLQAQRRRRLLCALPVLLLVTAIALVFALGRRTDEAQPMPVSQQTEEDAALPVAEPAPLPLAPRQSGETVMLGEEVNSRCAVVLNAESGEILAAKNAQTIVSPASMTKILTLLVAVEQIRDLDDTFTMTVDITDYCFLNDCSAVGYGVGETVSLRELCYGTILPSGADAALALAVYTAGSQENFVALMNEKLQQLGLSATAHFTNCVGLYDADHACTVSDMAVILKAAMENPFCRQVLGERKYETALTPEHPEGQLLSNWFLRRIEDRFPGDLQIVGAKTGYVVQSGSCAASCAQTDGGDLYICVTADADSSWKAIYDHTALYQAYCQ